MCRRLLTLLALSLTWLTASACDHITEYVLINKSVGKYKFFIPNIRDVNNSDSSNLIVDTEVIVSSVSRGGIQRIPFSYHMYRSWLDYIDVNDDGYIDLLIYNNPQVGPLTHADVWMFDPNTNKFNLSREISGRGSVEKSKDARCINIEFKINAMDYQTEKMCYSRKANKWSRSHLRIGE